MKKKWMLMAHIRQRDPYARGGTSYSPITKLEETEPLEPDIQLFKNHCLERLHRQGFQVTKDSPIIIEVKEVYEA